MQSFRTFLEEGDVLPFTGGADMTIMKHLRNFYNEAALNPDSRRIQEWKVGNHVFDKEGKTDNFSAYSTSSAVSHNDAVGDLLSRITKHGGMITKSLAAKHQPYDQQTREISFIHKDTGKKYAAVVRTNDHGFANMHQVHVVEEN